MIRRALITTTASPGRPRHPRWVSRVVAFLGAISLAASLPLSVLAAVWLELTPDSGVPGTEVHVDLMGAQPNPDGADMALFLVNETEAHASMYAPGTRTADVQSDERVLDLGESLVRDEDGNASAIFEIPEVPAGSYLIYFDCMPCSPGSIFAFGATLEVEETVFLSSGLSRSAIAIAAGVLLLVGLVVVRFRHRLGM